MQHSSVHLASSMAPQAYEPAGASGPRRASEDASHEEPFAALFAAFVSPGSGEMLPVIGKDLPAGAPASPLGKLGAGGAPLPSSAIIGDVIDGHGSEELTDGGTTLGAPAQPADQDAIGFSAELMTGSGSTDASSAAIVDGLEEPGLSVREGDGGAPGEAIGSVDGEHDADGGAPGAGGLRNLDDRLDGSDAATALREASRAAAASITGAEAAGPAGSAVHGVAGAASTLLDPALDVQRAAAAQGQGAAADELRGAPADLGDSVASRIHVMIDEGAGEARLKLNPPELGSIDVRISVIDDKTYVQMTASNQAGRDALEQSLPRLRELLAAGGLDLGGASVDGGGQGADPRGGSDSGTREPSYALHVTMDDDGVGLPSLSPRRAPDAAGRIDLYA